MSVDFKFNRVFRSRKAKLWDFDFSSSSYRVAFALKIGMATVDKIKRDSKADILHQIAKKHGQKF